MIDDNISKTTVGFIPVDQHSPIHQSCLFPSTLQWRQGTHHAEGIAPKEYQNRQKKRDSNNGRGREQPPPAGKVWMPTCSVSATSSTSSDDGGNIDSIDNATSPHFSRSVEVHYSSSAGRLPYLTLAIRPETDSEGNSCKSIRVISNKITPKVDTPNIVPFPMLVFIGLFVLFSWRGRFPKITGQTSSLEHRTSSSSSSSPTSLVFFPPFPPLSSVNAHRIHIKPTKMVGMTP